MSTYEATASTRDAMSEEARLRILYYAQALYASNKPANPFDLRTEGIVLTDLAISRQQRIDGKGRSIHDAIAEMRRDHGFV